MGLDTISIKKAVDKINANDNGWYLPSVQRPFVWGSRYESEKYICRLFDSIVRGYPIGTIIIWKTSQEVPYRKFIDEYENGKTSEILDKGLWSVKDKGLVYDGQQRLQTLFSCLKSSINKRVLIYDFLYKESDEDDNKAYGFSFIDKWSDIPKNCVSMVELYSKKVDEKVSYRNSIKKNMELDDEKENIFEERFDKLWSIFRNEDTKSLAFFEIDNSCNENIVNEIFQRLNTGGVPLSGADLLFSKLKEKYPRYEDDLNSISDKILSKTSYYFSSSEILQVINLIVKNTIRIDPSKIKKDDYKKFKETANKIEQPLIQFFDNFLFQWFYINSSAIISKKLALLPLIYFIYLKCEKGINIIKYNKEDVLKMKQFLILSQINDWNPQGIVEGCVNLLKTGDGSFTLDNMKELVTTKNRMVDVSESTLENNEWFILKILTPKRIYDVRPEASSKGKYKPELDHIFPMNLESQKGNPDYKSSVDIIWNKQPVDWKTNLDKSNKDPHEYFTNPDTSTNKYKYDFLPDSMDSLDWKDYKSFISNRKNKMIEFFQKEYSINIK